jgi:hypothetical protein
MAKTKKIFGIGASILLVLMTIVPTVNSIKTADTSNYGGWDGLYLDALDTSEINVFCDEHEEFYDELEQEILEYVANYTENSSAFVMSPSLESEFIQVQEEFNTILQEAQEGYQPQGGGVTKFVWSFPVFMVFIMGTLYEFWTNDKDSQLLEYWWDKFWPAVVTLLTGMFMVWYMIIIGFVIGLIIHFANINPWRDYNEGSGVIGYMFSRGLPFVSNMPIAMWFDSQ